MRPTTFRRCLRTLALASVLGVLVAGSVEAQADELPAELQIELSELLHTGLRTRLPEEEAFIDHVVDLVARKKLPLDLVVGTFLWARRRPPYPFPYFERGLRIRAARAGRPIYPVDRSPSFQQRSIFDHLRVP